MIRLGGGAGHWRAVTAISMTAAALAVSVVFAVMAMLIVNHE